MSLSREQAQAETRRFTLDYPGALHLAFYFRSSVADLYGARAAGVSPAIKGGYLCAPTEVGGKHYNGRVDVPLDNMIDDVDLLDSLRHEVLGHYGINTLASEVKRALLDAIIASADEPSLRPLWREIDEWYAAESLDVRSEEVFARRCETLPPPADVARVAVDLGRSALQDCCVSRRRPLTLRDLGAIACMVADGLRDRDRPQLTFLGVNDIRRRSSEPLDSVGLSVRPGQSPLLSGGLLLAPRPVAEMEPAPRAGFRLR